MKHDELISREQAIDALDGVKVDEKNCDEYDIGYNDGINFAISKLSVLPTAQPEPCEDAVSRKAVQYLLAHFVDEDKYVDACDGLKHLPPVTPKQHTGKWIPQDHNKRVGNISTCVYYSPICSKCGKVGNDTYKYCPHCGAKMNQSDKTCDCYSDGRCIGTKEIDPCSCGGNKSKCDFYENVRREGDAE